MTERAKAEKKALKMAIIAALLLVIMFAIGSAKAQSTVVTGAGPSTSSQVISLFTGCSGVQYLGADGACHAAGGGFTAPSGWVADSGGFTAGTFGLSNTVTSRTCNAFCYLYNESATIVPASGFDFKKEVLIANVAGPASGGTSTWSLHYDTGNWSITGGTSSLVHGLQDIERSYWTSVSGSTCSLCATRYTTFDLVGFAGTMTNGEISHLEYGGLDGAGHLPNLATLNVGVPTQAPTGGLTIDAFEGITVGDVTLATVPGTCRVGIYIGGTCAGSTKAALIVDALNPATLGNMAIFKTGAPVQIAGGLMVSSALNLVAGQFSGEDSHDVFGVVVNGQNSFHYAYDGSGAAEWGICTSLSSSFCIRRPAAAVNDLVIDRTSGLIKMLNFGPVNLMVSSTAPTISSGFGTSPSITTNNGTGAFTINVGTGGSATSGVIGLPTATNGWICHAQDLTTNSATVFVTKQTASSSTTATIGNFNTSGAAAAWVASDVLSVTCQAR